MVMSSNFAYPVPVHPGKPEIAADERCRINILCLKNARQFPCYQMGIRGSLFASVILPLTEWQQRPLSQPSDINTIQLSCVEWTGLDWTECFSNQPPASTTANKLRVCGFSVGP